MKKFVINLERCIDRMVYFDKSYTRWIATDYKDLDDNDEIFKKMISMWNISQNEHRAKCGCLLSHVNLWKHIADNKLNDILIVEDDALQVNYLPNDLAEDTFLYLGFYKKVNRW